MKKPSFLAVCMNPTLQKTLVFPGLVRDTVNRTGEFRLDASGKGVNVCRVLTQLGKEACHLTQLGGVLRPLFLELCGQDGLNVEWVESSSNIRFCYTIIEKEQKIITELVEESEKVGNKTEEELLEKFSKLISRYSSLIISGTKADGFSDRLVPEMVRRAKAESCRIILDVRGQDLLNSLPVGPDIVKPNLYEFISTFAPEMISKNRIKNIDNLKEKTEDICKELHEKFGCTFILTRGADPLWYTTGGKLAEFAAEHTTENTFQNAWPLNTIGCGDAFTAGLAASLEEGASLEEAITEGNRCGALNAVQLRPGVIR